MIQENIFLGLGSNVGDRLDYLNKAVKKIAQLPATEVTIHSSVYESAPLGDLEQDNFLNMIARISTKFTPEQFLYQIQKIENDLGRTREIHWGPRTIDIDILYWNDKILETDILTIPHPETEKRRFVLEPLYEVAPTFQAPPHYYSVAELLEKVEDENFVKRYLTNVPYKLGRKVTKSGNSWFDSAHHEEN